MSRCVRVLLCVVLLVVQAHGGRVGILYEPWHAYAASAMQNISNSRGQVLTVADVVTSNGAYVFSDILQKYNMEGPAQGFYYQDTPSMGFYCIYRKRPGEQGILPDCPNIERTLAAHASQLMGAGVDHVVVDGTNLGNMAPFTDALQFRPAQVLFEEWYALQARGVRTPQIAMWQTIPTGSNMYQIILDSLYNNETYSNLIMVDEKTKKKVFFVPDSGNNVDANILAAIQSNGGRNDIVVVRMWAQFSSSEFSTGKWTFFSPCVQNNQMGSSVVGVPCNQYVTTNSPLGSQMAVSPSYQMSYGSLPFCAPGKLRGLTFKAQFHNAMANRPDYLFLSSWNEWIAQPQANPYSLSTAVNMGLALDPEGRRLFVDSYMSEFSRDIEPTSSSNRTFSIMVSCLRVYLKGMTSCSDPSEECCNMADSNVFHNVWSLSATGSSDYLLSSDPNEVAALVKGGSYSQVCTAFGGTTVFCSNGAQSNPERGPFIMYSQAVASSVALYRCLEPTSPPHHFFSLDPACEGQKTESILGYLSTLRSQEMPRRFSRCFDPPSQTHYHALDVPCTDGHLEQVLGYTR